MDGLENLARNLGTYTAPTYGMSLQKPTVTYGVFLEDDDNLYSNMTSIFKKKSKATEPASAKPASTKPVTAKVKPVTVKVNPVTAKSASAKNKRAILVRNKTLVREANCAKTVGRKNCAVPYGNKTKPTVCSKLDKSEALIKTLRQSYYGKKHAKLRVLLLPTTSNTLVTNLPAT